jgi:hypothetical protein
MPVSDSDVIAELTESGPGISDYFIIGYEICAVNSDGQLSSLLIDDLRGEKPGEMHNAVLDFLRRRGVRVYHSHEEYAQRTG